MSWTFDFRAIIALSRFAGLRCPSEVLSLKWKNVDRENRRITVISPKTRRYAGGGQRVIPLFIELIKPLQEAWDAAPEGAKYVIPGRQRKPMTVGKVGRSSNL